MNKVKNNKQEEVAQDNIVEEVEKVEAVEEHDESEDKIQELENQFKRAVADYRNLEKRVQDERIQMIQFANRDLLLKLFPAFDTLFLAEKYVEDAGLKLSIKMLTESLKEVGVERIETEGKDYNPHLMEVVTTDAGEENKVLQELRPGFTLFGKVLRPAHVKVGKKE